MYIYTKKELIEGIREAGGIGDPEIKEKLIQALENADCNGFDYKTPVVQEMKITPVHDIENTVRRNKICGDVIHKVLKYLDVKPALKFPSTIEIHPENIESTELRRMNRR